MKKEYGSITYSLYICRNPRVIKRNKVWDLDLQQLSVEAILGVARAYKFPKASIVELIKHNSKEFTCIYTKRSKIVKSFHQKLVEIMAVSDDRQPINQRIKMLNKPKNNPRKQ